jgi:hypothetical protein
MAKEFFEDNESRVERKKEEKEKVWRFLVERFDWRKIFPFSSIACMFTTHLVLKFLLTLLF